MTGATAMSRRTRRPSHQEALKLNEPSDQAGNLAAATAPARNTAMRTAARVPAVRNGLAWRLSGLVYRDGK